jgi:hypothetical protein
MLKEARSSAIRVIALFQTKGNEGNEGFSSPAERSLCFLRYLLFEKNPNFPHNLAPDFL